MKKSMTALVLAAALTGVGATSVSAMDMEFNMLTGAVYNALKAEGFDTSNIDKLTLAEIAQLKTLLQGGDDNPNRTVINGILNK